MQVTMGPSSQECSQRGVRSPALHVWKQMRDPCWEPSPAAGRAPPPRVGSGEAGGEAGRPGKSGGPAASLLRSPGPGSSCGDVLISCPCLPGRGVACTHPEQPCPEPGAGPVDEGEDGSRPACRGEGKLPRGRGGGGRSHHRFTWDLPSLSDGMILFVTHH